MGMPKLVLPFFGLVLIVLAVQASRSIVLMPEPPPQPGQMCKGEPIIAGYPYQGGLLDPHACKVQCEDGRQRYVVYTNGMATQCQEPPGCLDWGEDNGVTCEPPLVSPAK